IFVTGFPGFIASRLIRRLAMEGARFILLTQPQFRARAESDVADLASQTSVDAKVFRIVEGDITKPDLGLSANELERARRETTTAFHLAAIYDLAVDRNTAERVNVDGTVNVNTFVKTVEKLRRYHYVSTCYV